MSLTYLEMNAHKIAELVPESEGIEDVQEALDLMAEASLSGTPNMILYEAHMPPTFFDLSSKVAGDILQILPNTVCVWPSPGSARRPISILIKDFQKWQ